MNTKSISRAVLLASVLFSFIDARAQLYIPTDSGIFNEGNSSLIRPFRSDSSRYQQVYSGSDFMNTVASNGILLRALEFRVDGLGLAFSGIASNLEVRASTTLSGPNSLNPVFADNIGLNETLVFGPSNQLVSGTFSPRSNAAQDWSVRLDFTTPFLYLPANGNLLLDFRVTGGVGAFLDAWNRSGDSVGSVAGAYSDISGTTSTTGLPTLFGGTVVPEPSIYALVVLGVVALLSLRKK